MPESSKAFQTLELSFAQQSAIFIILTGFLTASTADELLNFFN